MTYDEVGLLTAGAGTDAFSRAINASGVASADQGLNMAPRSAEAPTTKRERRRRAAEATRQLLRESYTT